MPDLATAFWYASLGFNIASSLACWSWIFHLHRRYKRDEHAQFQRWQAIEEEQVRAWRQRLQDLQAACPFCGLASEEDTFSP